MLIDFILSFLYIRFFFSLVMCRRILVIGAGGFVGSHIVKELWLHDLTPIGFSRFSSGIPEILSDIKEKTVLVKGDITDLPAIIDVIKKYEVDCIVNTASLLTTTSQNKPREAFKVNVEGTLNILECTRIMDVNRIVYISSTAVYGYSNEGEKITEEYPKNPVTLYGASKLFSEHLGYNYSIDYGIDFIALRYPIVFGPGQSYRGFSTFKDLIEKPVKRERVIIDKGGDQKYNVVYVLDAAYSVYLSCISELSGFKAYNISDGEIYSLYDLVKIIKELLPDAEIKIGGGYIIEEPIRGILDIRKAIKELGYRPQYKLKEAVKNYINYIRKQQHI